jgi:nucleotide-binding universal stress UspA family protein
MYGLGAQPREDEQRKAEASKAMAEHVQEFPAAPALTRIVQGDVVNALLGLRDELSAPIIVTGSRRLSALGRLFSASVGTELAASSVCPVAVVPPDREHLATAPRLPRAF